MNKRTLISAVTGIALAGIMCVGFAACGEGNESAKDLQGETIKKEVWDAAIQEDAFANFKLEFESTNVNEKIQTENTLAEARSTQATYVYSEQKTYVKGTVSIKYTGVPEDEKDRYKDESQTIEYYLDESGEEEYGKCVSKVDGKWTNVELTKDNYYNYNSAKGVADLFINSMLPSKNFEDYEYSEEHKGYIAKDAQEGELLVVKFKKGKLNVIYVESTSENSYGQGESQYTRKTTEVSSYRFTFGGQKLMLPKV